MTVSVKKKFIERCQQLIREGEKLKETQKENQIPDSERYISFVDRETFFQWKNSSENLIVKISSTDSSYYKDFYDYVKNDFDQYCDHNLHQLIAGIGILRSVKEDLEQGFLEKVQDLVVAEVFTDFLDQAEHLLKNGYKDPAASLAGAVLEDGLKKIAKKNDIPVKKRDTIDSLNQKLSQQQLYNTLKKSSVNIWREIRNSVAHGKFNDYKESDVKAMIDGIRNFLSEQF